MSFDPSLPQTFKENWRQAFRYENSDIPRLSTYQAPSGEPVPFVHDTTRFSGGQSVDTAEYPFFGLWSNTPLNELPQKITINGFVRGDEYIKNRNVLIESFRIITSDDAPGFLELPLWGRFPVIVIDWNIEESKQNGQCAVSVTFTRAGATLQERWELKGDGFDFFRRTEDAASSLTDSAIDNFAESLSGGADTGMMTSGFTALRNRLIGVVGRVQGAQNTLNSITNSAVMITNLLAQGIRAPKDLALAVFGATAAIVAGVMDIRNSINDASNFFSRNNIRNILMQFLSENNFKLDIEAITVREHETKAAIENLYRTTAICASASLLVTLEDNNYHETQGYWSLYSNLEKRIDQNDPNIYRALADLRLAVSRELTMRNLANELTKEIMLPSPILYLEKYLGCDEVKLRQLNIIDDFFIISGDITYV